MKIVLSIVALIILNTCFTNAQQLEVIKPNWYNLDLASDGVFGISMDKSYRELLSTKRGQEIVVGVIDGGLDLNHEDLKNVVWTNSGEIPGNGKDDDRNGYIDDVHGWNFLGSDRGSYEFGNDLIILELRNYFTRFGNKDTTAFKGLELADFQKYKAKQKEVEVRLKKLNKEIISTKQLLADLNVVVSKIGKQNPVLLDFEKFTPADATETGIRQFMISVLKQNPDLSTYLSRAKELLEINENDVNYHLNINYDPHVMYAEGPYDAKNRFYGNSDIYGPVPPAHGTHVAGVIGAQRNNQIGTDGVADEVQLMPVRAIPDGHATGRDQANAIRYAADNGARILNLSFGLGIETDSKLVKNALNYARKKDILIIQAAGNSHTNLDSLNNYPDRHSKADQKIADVFIKVGASGLKDNDQLIVPFSNFGKESVDVFAPGFEINSTVPGNKYEAHSGTSMAAPVVTGLAAVIRSYFPKLTARQVKDIIMRSVAKRESLKNLCISGGIVNAYNAIKLAASY